MGIRVSENLRIGMTGAGGTGKTTLAELISAKYDIPFLGSVSRGVFSSRSLTEVDQLSMTPVQQLELQKAIFAAVIEQREKSDYFVADRTFLDHMCYMLYRSGNQISDSYMEVVKRETLRDLRSYDLLIYCPTGMFTPPDDGFRQSGAAYSTAIDLIIRGALDYWDIPHISMGRATPEGRLRMVEKSLTSRLRAAC